MNGVVEIYIISGNEQVVIDYLGKGSVIGQYSILSKQKTVFGMRAAMSGTSSILCLGRETFETMRMKRQEVDEALLVAEDYIDKQGVPQIDFVMVNENSQRHYDQDGKIIDKRLFKTTKTMRPGSSKELDVSKKTNSLREEDEDEDFKSSVDLSEKSKDEEEGLKVSDDG